MDDRTDRPDLLPQDVDQFGYRRRRSEIRGKTTIPRVPDPLVRLDEDNLQTASTKLFG
jgi:hypothetical protein